MNYRKSVVLKKAWRLTAAAPRVWHGWSASPTDYRQRPPVLANSFPKSGTHLLVQILGALPGLRDWGNFWASQPSFSFRESKPPSMAARVKRAAPGELVGGHLYFSSEVKRALEERNVAHFFIYRDPRDVVVSEAHYLTHMNRWHRMHGAFKKLPSPEERLLLSINGIEGDGVGYPNVARRFERFRGWLGDPGVCSMRYEQLVSSEREEVVKRIIDYYCERSGCDADRQRLVEASLAAIDPARSHTFRSGRAGGWRLEFDEGAKSAFKRVAGKLLVDLGYESSLAW